MNEEELNEQETLPEKESKEKTFTQDEVDRIVSDRLKRGEDKLRAKLLEEAKQQVREEQDEAKKLEEMNANQHVLGKIKRHPFRNVLVCYSVKLMVTSHGLLWLSYKPFSSTNFLLDIQSLDW